METTAAVSALAALAQETRLEVFRLLVQQGPSGLAAGEIASRLGIAPATLSFHLKELSHAGLVTTRQVGRYVFYSADFGSMNLLLEFLTENCCVADGGACVSAPCLPPRGASAAEPSNKARAVRRKVSV
jgi:ArsR family transcriptional regulator, arsenate/arsenite/antimonite-responsive transcriptional repressor